MFDARSDFLSFAEGLAVDAAGDRLLIGYAELWKRVAATIGSSPRTSVAELGRSVDGEPLWAVAIDPEAEVRETILVVAGLHAMEHIGCLTALRLIERAIGDAMLWPETRLVIVPIANADGFLDVCRDRALGRRCFRRKNRNGVDLNRNFSTNRPRPRRRAAGPLSEPEAAAIDRVLSHERPRIAVSLHAFGRFIFTPWAGAWKTSPRAKEHRALAKRMIRAQPGPKYRHLRLGRTVLFQVRGTELDHFCAAGALSFLIEIGKGPALRAPRTWIDPYRWYSPDRQSAVSEVANVIAAIEALSPRLWEQT